MDGRTNERGGRTARKHNAFADTGGWRRPKIFGDNLTKKQLYPFRHLATLHRRFKEKLNPSPFDSGFVHPHFLDEAIPLPTTPTKAKK